MKKVFLLLFVSLLFGMIGSVSCGDSEAEIEPGGEESARPPAPVPQTGQTTCWDTNGNVIDCFGTWQDGDIQAGVVPPTPRFTDNGDGTIKDNLTGLIWLKDANCFGLSTWVQALRDARTLKDGECGLTDGSVEGDWYLPNVRELFSLIDFEKGNGLVLPTPNPFMNFQAISYWSSSTSASLPNVAWVVDLGGGVGIELKSDPAFVTAVRGGS